MKPTSSQKKINVKLDLAKGLGDFVADNGLLRVIIQSLLSNAIKYTPRNGEVIVSTKKTARKVQIFIKDNGYGVPKSNLSRLFNKFYRAENVIKQNIEGTGLGLYIIKLILEVTGGDIKVKPKEGKGSEFIVSFPAKGMKAKTGTRQLS